jgi:hypothetical protein
MSNSLFARALTGDDYMPKSVVGHHLLICRYFRAMRACCREGCYAWLRLTADLKAAQRNLLEYRNGKADQS